MSTMQASEKKKIRPSWSFSNGMCMVAVTSLKRGRNTARGKDFNQLTKVLTT